MKVQVKWKVPAWGKLFNYQTAIFRIASQGKFTKCSSFQISYLILTVEFNPFWGYLQLDDPVTCEIIECYSNIQIITWFNFFLGLSVRENPDRTRLTFSSFADPLQFASLCWWPLFSLFLGATLYFLLALLFARNSPFYLCPLLFSFAFLSPYSAYFGVLSNFLVRFSGLALRCLLFAFFGSSVSLYSAYFQLKPSLHELEL